MRQTILKVSKVKDKSGVMLRFTSSGGGCDNWALVVDEFLDIAEDLNKRGDGQMHWPEGKGRLGSGAPLLMPLNLFARVYSKWSRHIQVRKKIERGDVAVELSPKGRIWLDKKMRAFEARRRERHAQHVASQVPSGTSKTKKQQPGDTSNGKVNLDKTMLHQQRMSRRQA